VSIILTRIHDVDWGALDRFDDRVVFQTQAWVNFLATTQDAMPVIASLSESGNVVGYFTGLIFSRMGVRILGSPFPGWTTAYMGFNLAPGVKRAPALRALGAFAFEDLNCLHLEVADRFSSESDGDSVGFTCELSHTLVSDLTQSEEDLFGHMAKTCRWSIRKAEKSGVHIEEAVDEGFADDYCEQLNEVFGRQGLVTPYGRDRVTLLIRHMLPTDRLLLLRARDSKESCIATGIFLAFNKRAELWGCASFRHTQHFQPNELLNWYAMKCMKRRGIEIFDWGGVGEHGRYKAKYGGHPVSYPRFRKSRIALIGGLRSGAMKLYQLKQSVLGRLSRHGN
jgi:hypothetical protein